MADDPDLQRRYRLAHQWAREAGRLTLDHYDPARMQIERKPDRTPVTAADRAAEQWLRRQIQQRFSQDAIVGEEFGESAGTSGFRWILDPIDGTKSFICGVPLFGTMVGLERDGEPVAGAVHIAGLDEGVHAARGQGAWWYRQDEPPRPARVAAKTQLADCVVLTSEISAFAERGRSELFHQLESASYFARTWGDCYGYLLVATGRADVMIDPQLSIWDAAAVAPILVEAGGQFLDWTGQPRIDSGHGLGAYSPILDQVLEMIR